MRSESKSSTPRLRFPEYREASKWNSERLGDHLDYLQPTPYLVSSTNYDDSFDIPVLTAGKTFILGYTDEIDGVFRDELPVIIFDDFTTASKYVDFPFKAKSSAMKMLLAKGDANLKFFYELMQVLQYEVGAHERHWISEFAEFMIPVPDTHEQQQIADCLSSLDFCIETEIRKLGALKANKQGLMQQLFPAEGQCLPRLRFPGFNGEWKKKIVSDFGEVITGGTPSTAKTKYYGGKFLFVSPADISDLRFIETTRTGLTDLGFVQTRQIEANSVLFVCIGSTIGKIAQNLERCATNQQINSIVPYIGVSGDFLYYLLSNESDRIAKLAGNHAVPIINKSMFSAVTVFSPELLEQRKIAACLSSLDELIASQSDKVAALQRQKNGLLQGLFPVLDAKTI